MEGFWGFMSKGSGDEQETKDREPFSGKIPTTEDSIRKCAEIAKEIQKKD